MTMSFISTKMSVKLVNMQTNCAQWSHRPASSALIHRSWFFPCAHILFSHPGPLFDLSRQSECDENGWSLTEINLSFMLRETRPKYSLKGAFHRCYSAKVEFFQQRFCFYFWVSENNKKMASPQSHAWLKLYQILVKFFSFDLILHFLFKNKIHTSSELERERKVLVLQGDPEAISIPVTCCTT